MAEPVRCHLPPAPSPRGLTSPKPVTTPSATQQTPATPAGTGQAAQTSAAAQPRLMNNGQDRPIQPESENESLRFTRWIEAKLPQVVAAQRKHRALIRRLRRRWVFAVFPRAFEFADSWVPAKTRRQRLAQLRPPRGYPPGKFPFRGAHWNAAIYPEAVALTGVLASPRWRSSGLAADDKESLQLIVQQIRTRALPDYDPGQESEPIFEWLTLLHDPSRKRLRWTEVRRYEEDVMARETGTKPSQAYYEFLPPRLGGTGRLSARSHPRGPRRVRAR